MQNEKVNKKDEEALLESMFYSPSAGDADPSIEIEKTTDDNVREAEPEAPELLKILESGEGELSEKYKQELLDKALKDPSSIEVNTPRGWMTVRDAIGDGFDLTTGDFTNEAIPKVDWEGEISKLDPREQETIRKLTKPGTRQAGPSAPMPEGIPEGMPPMEGEEPPAELPPTELPEGASIPLGGE